MSETPGLHLEPRTPDNKMMVQSSSRPIGTYSCFTSEGDNTSHPHFVGGGQRIMSHHEVGDSTVYSVYMDFNTIENKTYLQEGYGFWTNAYYDTLNLEVVPAVTPYTDGTGTYFNLYNGYLIIPAAGDGNINVNPADIKLVEIPYSIDVPSQRQSPAFWDADYDSTVTHSFLNIRPNPYGTGAYNIFGSEIVMQRPVNLCVIGNHSIILKTSDIAEITHGLRLRFTFITDTVTDPDHEWQIAICLAMHRQHPCSF